MDAPRSPFEHGFVRAVRLERSRVPGFDRYPFHIPAVRTLDELDLDPKITFLVGENGSGKSTLIEAIAVASGFNAEGGTKNFRFATRSSESELHRYLRIVRSVRRQRDGFFLRTESTFNLATEIENLGLVQSYGGTSLHERSHGESLLALIANRFSGQGLYILDEPEAALSPSRQLALLQIMHGLIERRDSQFLVATHSPILLAYPGALILQLGKGGMEPVAYEETEHFRVTRDFLADRDAYLARLFADDEG